MRSILISFFLNSYLIAQSIILPESTVAVVNGTAISEDMLDKELGKLLPKTYYHSTLNESKLKSVKEKALETLIENTLLYNYAISNNIDVNEAEIKDTINKLIEEYGSEYIFDQALKKIGYSKNSFIKAVKREEVIMKLYKQEIEVSLSDNYLKKYYEANKYKFKEPEKIKVKIIYVRNDPVDPKGKSKAKEIIELAEKKLNEGENFPFVAQSYSDDPSRVKGGDLGYLHRGMLDKSIEDEVFSMDENTTSAIIERDIGYYIVKVEKKNKQNQLAFDDIKEKLRADLKEKKEKEAKSALIKTLLLNAVIIK